MSLKVLVADDSTLFRHILTDALGSFPDVNVVGCAPNGRLALQRIRELHPDVVTLDMEMPEMDGLAVLDALKRSHERVDVIVVSALTSQGGQLTLKALEKGAFDFITKPDSVDAAQGKETIIRELLPRLRALAHRREIRSILQKNSSQNADGAPAAKPVVADRKNDHSSDTIAGRMNRLTCLKPEMVLIGVSTGGPNALASLLPELPATIGVPLVIVQHMPPVFTQSLAESLSSKCAIRIREAATAEQLEPGVAYIAPGGRQMRLVSGPGGTPTVQITDDPPENNCRPAVDYLFRSVSNNFPGRAMAVILTGMGSDGTIGLRLLKRHGCYVIAQDEASSVVYGMPKAAVDAGVVDAVLPLDAIAAKIRAAVRGVF